MQSIYSCLAPVCAPLPSFPHFFVFLIPILHFFPFLCIYYPAQTPADHSICRLLQEVSLTFFGCYFLPFFSLPSLPSVLFPSSDSLTPHSAISSIFYTTHSPNSLFSVWGHIEVDEEEEEKGTGCMPCECDGQTKLKGKHNGSW